MSCKVKFTLAAKDDLKSIALYIAEKAKDKKIAIEFVNELKSRCRQLETFPESGAFPMDRVMKSAGYRFLIHKEYLIFYSYEQKENTAYILAVFNAKRDYMKVMKKFI